MRDVIGQRTYANVLEVRGAPRVVPLERERAVIDDALEIEIGAERRVGLDVVHHEHVVHADLHLLAANQDVHPEPLVVVDQLLVDVAHGVEGTRLLPFLVSVCAFVRVGHLHFESRRGPARGLIRGVEVDAGVRARPRHHIRAQLKVLEVGVVHGTHIEQVRAVAVDDNLAVHDFEGVRMLVGFPSVKRLAVKQGNPVSGIVMERVGGRWRGQQ